MRCDLQQVQKQVSVLNRMNYHQPGRCILGNSEQHEENRTEPLTVRKWDCQRPSVGVGRNKINTSPTSPDMWSLSLCSLQKQKQNKVTSKQEWNKDLFVGESLTCLMATCLFLILPMEHHSYSLICLKRKKINKIKSKVVSLL